MNTRELNGGWRRDLVRRAPWQVIVPVVGYLVLVVLGITTSSIGVAELRQDPTHPLGHQWGDSLDIRSDEFLTGTPYALGVTATGSAASLNPLTAPHTFVSLLGDGPVASVVLFDGAILRMGTFLPDASLFAARWWLPALLLLLGAPVFFRRVTGHAWMGWVTAGLMIGSPLTVWWSLSPLSMLGFTFAGSAALLNCTARWHEGARWRAVAWGAVAALLLARTPLHYQPWAIVVAVPILLVAVVVAVVDAPRVRSGLLVVAAVGLGAFVLLAGLAFESWASIQATSQTLYPGRRVSTGTPIPFAELFGATGLGNLEYEQLTQSNDSEISSSYAIAAVLAAILAGRRLTFSSRGHRVATIVAGALTAFWFSWAMLDYGTLGSHIPVVNLVPAARAADVVGLLALLLLGLLLPAIPPRSGWRAGLVAAIPTALVSGYAVSLLRQQYLPQIHVWAIWMGMVVVGLIAYLVTTRPRHVVGYALALLAAAGMVARVNPVLMGLGDLRASQSAQQMLTDGAALRASGGVWASDSMYVDALMLATGVPSLSSRQLAGPNRDMWRALAPTAAEDTWNRGGSFITFVWQTGPGLTVDNPQPDVIVVHASPCTVAERIPALRSVISSKPLSDGCLAPAGTFQWSGKTQYRYTIGQS